MDKRNRFTLTVAILLGMFSSSWGGVSEQLERIGSLGSSGEKRVFLPAEQAFVMTHDVTSDGTLSVTWNIEPGYYLYRQKMAVIPRTSGLVLSTLNLPAGESKNDPEFGRVAIYRQKVSFDVPIERWPAGEPVLDAVVSYQGCAEDGICYPPLKKLLSLRPGEGTRSPRRPMDVGAFRLSETDSIAVRLSETSFAVTIAIFLGLGFLLAFTPCVLPMVPILSGIIVGQKERVTAPHAFALSLTYVVAMAITYALAGIAAGLLGHNLQATFQQPLAIIGFSAVFVALACAMFGLYSIQLPTWLQAHIDRYSRAQQSGNFGGVAIMGTLSALIVGPCVAPPLAGALTYISQTGSALVGGSALFALGLGMGVPLIVLGTSIGTVLPKTGLWMERVKKFFGLIFLGVAIWFMGRILPGPVTQGLWALLAFGTAVFFGAMGRLHGIKNSWQRASKVVAAVAFFYGTALGLGASVGGVDPFKPFAPFVPNSDRLQPQLDFVSVKGVRKFGEELKSADKKQQITMLDFYADWCVECKYLERETFANDKVAARLKTMALLRADVTANDDEDKALLSQYGLFGPPAVLFFRNGKEMRRHRLVGFVKPSDFVTHLDRL